MISTTLSPITSLEFANTTPIIEFNFNSTSNYLYTSSTIDATNSTNDTSSYNDGFFYPVFPSYIRTTSMVFCVIIMCLGVIGNIMVPIVIFKTKDMRNSTNIFLVNLSVADLMVLLVCTPTVLVEVNSLPETWVLGEEMCKAVPFVELTVAHASVLTILAISFERYYAICKPLKAGYICTKTRASLICLLAWFIAAVLTSPILGIAEYHHIEYYDGSKVPTCQTLANTFWPFLYFLSTIVLFFIVPLIILIVLYLIIAKTLISNAATLVLNKHIDSYSNRARRQVILMLGTVVLSFFLCLIPFRVFILWIIIAPEEKVYEIGGEKYYNILYFCRFMLYLNSAINPILYNLMSSKFRTGFLICSKEPRGFYFKRSRNGTFSTTANSSRSSMSRSHHEGYRVCARPRNNSIIVKNLNESPVSIRSTDSHSHSHSHSNAVKESPRFKNSSLTSNCVIDEACEDSQARNGNPSRNVITENVLVYSNTKHRVLKTNVPKCSEVIVLKEKFVRDCGRLEEESLV